MSIFKPILLSIILFLIIISFFIAGSVFADSSSYYGGDGVTIVPIENKYIVLKNEIVKIKPKLKDDSELRWLAECEFIFYNKSENEEAVTMGYTDWLDYYFYPEDLNDNQKKLYYRYSEEYKGKKQLCERDPQCEARIYFEGYSKGRLPYFKKAWKVHDLIVIVDGSKIKTNHKPIDIIKADNNSENDLEKKYEKYFANGSEYSLGAFIWQVRFAPKETRVVKVTFSFRGLQELTEFQLLSYLLRTGALWADKIEQADIYWDLKGRKLKVEDIRPKGYKINNNVIHWHFENFKPSEDIGIFVRYKN